MLSKNKTISGKQNHTKCAIENIKHFLAVEYLKKNRNKKIEVLSLSLRYMYTGDGSSREGKGL